MAIRALCDEAVVRAGQALVSLRRRLNLSQQQLAATMVVTPLLPGGGLNATIPLAVRQIRSFLRAHRHQSATA